MPEDMVEMIPENEGEASQESGDGACTETQMLREELEALRSQLKAREDEDRASARMRAELSGFAEYFPEVELEEIPEEIWDRVRRGASLSSEYSLLLHKREMAKRRIGEYNEKNRKMSAGAVGIGEGEKYYSPSEVKKMSPAYVKAHYDDIIESMRHWN